TSTTAPRTGTAGSSEQSVELLVEEDRGVQARLGRLDLPLERLVLDRRHLLVERLAGRRDRSEPPVVARAALQRVELTRASRSSFTAPGPSSTRRRSPARPPPARTRRQSRSRPRSGCCANTRGVAS